MRHGGRNNRVFSPWFNMFGKKKSGVGTRGVF
jgi:hypothetical protein